MDFIFKGKNVVVFGGICGIGWVIVVMLVGEGVNVVVCVCNVDQVVVIVVELKVGGIKVIGGLVDVIDGVVLKFWIEGVVKEFGGIDLFFFNVGVMV